jgi:hypothetical protein
MNIPLSPIAIASLKRMDARIEKEHELEQMKDRKERWRKRELEFRAVVAMQHILDEQAYKGHGRGDDPDDDNDGGEQKKQKKQKNQKRPMKELEDDERCAKLVKGHQCKYKPKNNGFCGRHQ